MEDTATEETEERDSTLKEDRDNESSSPSSNSELGNYYRLIYSIICCNLIKLDIKYEDERRAISL